MVQLTRAQAEAWSRHGVTAQRDRARLLRHAAHRAGGRATRSAGRRWPARTFIGRNGELDDLRGTAIFLASRASDYITGQTIFVDGGFTAG